MADRATSQEAELTQLRAELEERGREVERLRGLLIERDFELGEAKGRLTELEDHLRRLVLAVHRILRIPGAVRLALAALARLGRPRRKSVE